MSLFTLDVLHVINISTYRFGNGVDISTGLENTGFSAYWGYCINNSSNGLIPRSHANYASGLLVVYYKATSSLKLLWNFFSERSAFETC